MRYESSEGGWQNRQNGKMGWILLWLLGVPIPILLVLYFLRGCTWVSATTEAGLQIVAAWAYYAGLVGLMRLSGKRLAGQTTSFDLIVLISLAVVLQQLALRGGPVNALTFVVAVFVAHRITAWACSRSSQIKRFVRGSPRPLVVMGRVSYLALEEEGLSYEDLLAGLRKVGEADPRRIRLATLEETGQISVVVDLASPAQASA